MPNAISFLKMFRHFLIFLALVAVSSAVPADIERGGRIVGGTSVSIASRPFMASLRNIYNSHFCGASILNNRFVITAAHCVFGSSATSVLVVVGTATLNSGGTFYSSSDIFCHSGYSESTLSHDIALVKTATGIQFSANVAYIPLPTSAAGGGTAAIVSGWGKTSTNGAASNQLLALNVTTMSNAICSRYLSITADQMCTLSQVSKGVCFGDSGSALTSANRLIGITSFVVGGCAGGYPDGFARVYEHIPWIFTYLQPNYN